MQTIQADYFTAYRTVKLTRDANGVLVVQLHTDRRPCVMTAHTHRILSRPSTVFRRIGRTRL
jgi:hypothetical protein